MREKAEFAIKVPILIRFARLGAEEESPKRNSMCNLYSMRKPRDEVVGIFGISHVDDGVQLELPAVYPDTMAPVIRLDNNGARNLTMMRWGFPPPPKGGRASYKCPQHQKLLLAELVEAG